MAKTNGAFRQAPLFILIVISAILAGVFYYSGSGSGSESPSPRAAVEAPEALSKKSAPPKMFQNETFSVDSENISQPSQQVSSSSPSHMSYQRQLAQITEPVYIKPEQRQTIDLSSGDIPDSVIKESHWGLSAFYGAKYLSIRQKNSLGNAQVSLIATNYTGMASNFSYGDWELWTILDTYKLKYESLNSAGEKQLSSLQFGVAWKMIWLGLRAEETPLFKKNSGSVEMAKQNFIFASLGTNHLWRLSTNTPTELRLLTRLTYPLFLDSNNSSISVSNPKGFGLGATLELKRELYKSKSHRFFVTLPIRIDYQSFSQNVNWAPSQGDVKTEFISVSTALGISFEF